MKLTGMICAGLLLLLVGEAAAVEQMQADIRPQAPLIERTAFGDSLNFDIWVTNPTDQPLQLGSIEISYLDGGGAELYTRTVDYNGRALDTIPDRTIAPKASKLVYNPHPILPPDVKPQRVKVRMTLYKPPVRGVFEPVVVQVGVADVRERVSPALAFPMKGRVFVWDGHDLSSHHRRWDYANPGLRAYGSTANASRYSYDFVVVDAQNRMTTADDEKNESSLTFGAPVYAPGAGVVVEAVGSKADDKTFDNAEAKVNPNTSFGNYVVIDHGNGLFSLLGHLHQGSVKVKAGDRVVPGQHIAGAGASGSSLFAHLHYQLMDGRNSATAEGVPSYFRALVKLRGSRRAPVDGVSIDSGDVVWAE